MISAFLQLGIIEGVAIKNGENDEGGDYRDGGRVRMKKPNIKLNIRITLGVFVFLFVILGDTWLIQWEKYGHIWFSHAV